MRMDRPVFRGEKGQALIYVTLVMVLTMIVIPPLLGFMGGAGRSAQIREDRMLQVYAADAGIEDGFFKVTKGNVTELPWSGNISDLNGHDVSIQIEQEAGGVYKITSTATNYAGSEVTVESYAASLDYSYLFNNAISSYGDVKIRSGAIVEGNITLNDELNNKGTIDGNTTYGLPGWPGAEELKDFYWDDVEGLESYPSDTILLGSPVSMGPLYRDGQLFVKSGNETAVTRLTLDGTFYSTEEIWIGHDGKDFVLDLNGQTIFSAYESQSTNDYAIWIGTHVQIEGSGCIVAIGDVKFQPQIQTGNDSFVFVISVNGDLSANPLSNFWGGLAGQVEVEFQPGVHVTWIPPEFEANFPDGDLLPGVRAYIIRN